jgi:hypothetical protein
MHGIKVYIRTEACFQDLLNGFDLGIRQQNRLLLYKKRLTGYI